MKKYLAVVALLAVVSTGCGGGGSSGGSGLNNATTVAGTVYADNGDPVPGATVSIPSEPVTNTAKAVRIVSGKATGACGDPAETSCASVCTAADGTFTLPTTDCPATSSQMVLQKGALRKVFDLNCPGTAECDLTDEESTFSGSGTTYPKVMVVTGAWDRMQDVLAKVAPDAYGTIDPTSFSLEPGEENPANLTFVDGDSTLDETYDDFSVYLDGTKSFSGFDIVFINCGTYDYSEETYLTTEAKQRLSDYVNNGGVLYVTDRSYDFISQVFPSFMNFHGSVSATDPGEYDAAEEGYGNETLNATVSDTTMQGWLGAVTVIAHDTDTPGNPKVDCDIVENSYTTRTGALTSDNKIPVDDFLGDWALMDGKYDASTTVWISSGVGTSLDDMDNRPMTASQVVGSGKLFYSSYHTADQCPTLYFWPQERVLQYLIFEAF